jgi:aspartyl protease
MRIAAFAVALSLCGPAAADPLHLYNGRLFIAARVNDVATEALLDSAAEATLVDPRFAAQAKFPHGTAQEIRGSGGKANAEIVEGIPIQALGLTLHPEAVVVTDLGELSRWLVKRPTSVVIGRELFDAARLRIDIAQGRIEVVGRNTEPAGRRLALTAQHGVEAIPVLVNGNSVRAEFDLGNGSDVLISRELVNRLGLRTIGRKAGGGIGGEVERDLVQLTSLDVADLRLRNVVAAIDDQSNAADLNVGTSVLKHFLITADYHDRAVWLLLRRSDRIRADK